MWSPPWWTTRQKWIATLIVVVLFVLPVVLLLNVGGGSGGVTALDLRKSSCALTPGPHRAAGPLAGIAAAIYLVLPDADVTDTRRLPGRRGDSRAGPR